MAAHVRVNSWYIAVLRKTATRNDQILRFLENVTTSANFSYFYLELNAFVAYLAEASFNTDRHNEKFQIIAKLQSKTESHFFLGVVLAVAVVDA